MLTINVLVLCVALFLAHASLLVESKKIIGDLARFHSGPPKNTWIRESKTTLILPPVNEGQKGFLCIWPGLDENTGKLVQSVAISDRKSKCNGERPPRHTWILMASVYNEKKGNQHNGDCKIGHPGDHVTIHYKYNSDNNGYDQSVSLNGDTVSTFSTHHDGRKGRRWYTAIECQDKPCGKVPAHKYIDTTIILDDKDPNYGDTVVNKGAKGRLKMKDGGRVWEADEILVESHVFH